MDVALNDGSTRQLFVRVARPGDPLNSPMTLAKEAELAGVLTAAGVRVAQLVGLSRERHLAAYERLPGRSDITELSPSAQQQIYLRFLEDLGRLHSIDIDSLPMRDWHRPASAREVAPGGARRVVCRLRGECGARIVDRAAEPPRCLRPSVAARPRATATRSVVSGTRRCGHAELHVRRRPHQRHHRLGMGSLQRSHGGPRQRERLHAVFHPSGDWPELLAHYERTSGIPVEVERVSYYRAHLAVRSAIMLGAATATWDSHDPFALNLCYRTVIDRICCECMAVHSGIALERPVALAARRAPDPVHRARRTSSIPRSRRSSAARSRSAGRVRRDWSCRRSSVSTGAPDDRRAPISGARHVARSHSGRCSGGTLGGCATSSSTGLPITTEPSCNISLGAHGAKSNFSHQW